MRPLMDCGGPPPLFPKHRNRALRCSEHQHFALVSWPFLKSEISNFKFVVSAVAAAIAFTAIPICAQSKNPPHRSPPAPLEVIVLASGGPRATPRGSTAYIVSLDGTPRILVDSGANAFVEIGKLGLDLDKMDIVLLTHLHIDHTADLPAVLNERALNASDPIHFKIFGPAGSGLFPPTTKFIHLLFDSGSIYEYQKTFGADESLETTDLPITLDSSEKEIVQEGNLHISEIATHHGDCPSVAYRITYKDASVTFAGDMDASALPNLERLAQNTNLLVVHAAVLDPPGSPDILYTLHTPPKQLGQAAAAAHVKNLVLSHIPPQVENNEPAVLRSIRAFYKGPVTFASNGSRFPVRP
jgi:ribonuclease BN (tRNA processing enzyme)